jgi:hypothetical protein
MLQDPICDGADHFVVVLYSKQKLMFLSLSHAVIILRDVRPERFVVNQESF